MSWEIAFSRLGLIWRISGEGFGVVQVDVVDGDQVPLVGLARFPEPRGDDPHQADQGAGLLETLVLAEAGVKVLDGRVERIAGLDELRKLLGRLGRDVHLLGLADGLGVGLRDLGDIRLFGQGLEKPLAEDVIKLVGVDLHRGQVHRVPLGLVLEMAEDVGNLGAGLGIGAQEVGEDDADVAKLPLGDGLEEVRQCGGGYPRKVGASHRDRLGVIEVRRQLVKQNKLGLALQQIDPRRPARGLQGRVVRRRKHLSCPVAARFRPRCRGARRFRGRRRR